MKSIIVGFGFSLLLVGCGPDPKEINARMQKHFGCTKLAEKKYSAAIEECTKRFGGFGSAYSACYETASDQFGQEYLNCSKLEEH